MLSIESGLITCGTRIIVTREMRPEMLCSSTYMKVIRARSVASLGQRTLVLAHDHLWHPTAHRQVYDLAGVWKVSSTHRNYPGATLISMACIGDRFVLLEKNGLSGSCRCLFQIYPSEEIVQFYLCCHVHRIVCDCHRVGFASYNQEWQWSMLQFQGVPTVPATLQHHTPDNQPKSSNGSNVFVERMVGVAKKLMEKAGKEAKLWISGLFDYRVTPQSSSIASPL